MAEEDHLWRRGINRPNAQHLSVSLAPLMAQRSLLFRIQADLADAGKESYNELEELEQSPSLYSITPSAGVQMASAKFVNKPKASNVPATSLSMASVMSPASVYSQESWKPGSSLFAPTGSVDRSRYAMAFSPSVQWDDPSLDSGVLDFRDGLCRRRITALPVPTPPSRTPLSARLNMSISTSTSGRVVDCKDQDIEIGSIRLTEEPKSVIALRLRTEVLDSAENRGQEKDNTSASTDCLSLYDEHGASIVEPSQDEHTSSSELIEVTNGEETEGLDSKKVSKRSNALSRMIRRVSRQTFKKDKGKPHKDPRVRFSSLRLPQLRLSPIKVAFDLSPDNQAPPSDAILDQPAFTTLHKFPSNPPSLPTTYMVPSIISPTPSPKRIPPDRICTPHEAPPSTSARDVVPSTTSFRRHSRTRSSPTIPPSDMHPQWDAANMPPLPPLPPMITRVPKPDSLRRQSLVTMPSSPGAAAREPPPRPSRSKRPPNYGRTHSQSGLLFDDNAKEVSNPSVLHNKPQTQAERWEEIIATIPISPRPRGRSFSAGMTMGAMKQTTPM